MMEAAQISETVVNLYQSTLRYNQEGSHLHTHRRENLKSYNMMTSNYDWLYDFYEYQLKLKLLNKTSIALSCS
jgi:hypothetical protein